MKALIFASLFALGLLSCQEKKNTGVALPKFTQITEEVNGKKVRVYIVYEDSLIDKNRIRLAVYDTYVKWIGRADYISVFMYTSREKFECETGFWIAMLSKVDGEGEVQFSDFALTPLLETQAGVSPPLEYQRLKSYFDSLGLDLCKIVYEACDEELNIKSKYSLPDSLVLELDNSGFLYCR